MARRQVVAPAAINALKEALSLVYWYKSQLRSFVTNTVDAPEILARLNWQDYKRNTLKPSCSFLPETRIAIKTSFFG